MIYLDHHASTPLLPEVRTAVVAALALDRGNASSVHGAGRAARALVEDARAALAGACGAMPRELVFTSGGTEAVHLAVRGVGEAAAVRSVFVHPGAHPSLWAAVEALCAARACPLERVPTAPRSTGVDADALRQSLAHAPGPALVAVPWVQHETGAITALPALRDALRPTAALLVLDAVQALGKIPLDLGASGAAAAALSAHKIGGPTGVGAAWLAADARADALTRGGAQERGLRAGTENVMGIVGLGAAALALPARLAAMPAVASRRDRLERAVLALADVVLNGAEGPRVATALHCSLRGVAGEELVAALDLEGFCVSSGPACASGRPEPSRALLALYPDEPWRASSALRVTLGPETTDDDVDALARALPAVLARFRAT